MHTFVREHTKHATSRRVAGLDVAEVLVSALGDDGRLDLAHATIAERALCHPATVRRALGRLRDVGLVYWVRRLVRGPDTGWRCEQGPMPTCCERLPATRRLRDQLER
jgi:hypothetical protein